MCGIAGAVGGVDTRLLETMTGALKHRGPDDIGYDTHMSIQLGACRLAILDIKGGRQPIYDEARNRCIVFNGEIYNHNELRCHLRAHGRAFRTKSDAEVVLQLYDEHGPACLEALDGMYAVAIRDGNELWLARDRLGIKPLYYTIADHKFLFASEIKGLLRCPAVSVSLDLQALADRVALGYAPEPRTFLQGIHSLAAGHWMRISLGRTGFEITTRRYDHGPKGARPGADLSESVDTLDRLMTTSVDLQAHADVPVALTLSGGLDSSLIAHWLSKVGRTDVTAFVTVDALAHPDLQVAERVSQQLGLRLVTEIPSFSEYLSTIPELILSEEQPGTLDGMPMYLLLKRVRDTAKVCLTGEGADELFGGYPEYMSRQQSLAERQSRKQRLAEAGLTLTPAAQQIIDRLAATTSLDSYLSEVFRTNMRDALVRQHLELIDKYGMASGVECRVPYLGRKIVDFVTAMPLQLRVNTSTGIQKYVLKRLALERGGPALVEPSLRQKLGLPSVGLHHETRFAALCERLLPPDYVSQHRLSPLFSTKRQVLLFELFIEAFVTRRGRPIGDLDVLDFMRSGGLASSSL